MSNKIRARIERHLKETSLDASVVLLEKDVPVGDLLDLSSGSLLPLGVSIEAPALLKVGGKVIANGSVVSVEDKYGLKINEVLP